MYRENAAPPPPDPLEAARTNARYCGCLQLFIAGMNIVNALSIFTSLQRMARQFQQAKVDVDPETILHIRQEVLWVVIPYVGVMAIWAALNYWGLKNRSKIAFVSSVVFACASLLSCFSILFVGVLFYMLFKREMKGYFDAQSPTGVRRT